MRANGSKLTPNAPSANSRKPSQIHSGGSTRGPLGPPCQSPIACAVHLEKCNAAGHKPLTVRHALQMPLLQRRLRRLFSLFAPPNEKAPISRGFFRALSGEDRIRTCGTVLPVHRFSKPTLSTTQPPLQVDLQGRSDCLKSAVSCKPSLSPRCALFIR